MKLFLAAALVGLATIGQAATITISGEAQRADPLAGLNPFRISFETQFDVEDDLVRAGSLGGGDTGLPVIVDGDITINDTTFADGDIGLQLFSNAVFGIRLNLASITDGTTDVTPDINDFRLFGSSNDTRTLVDAVDRPISIFFSDIAFFEVGSTSPSQGSVMGAYTLSISNYSDIMVAPVPLQATLGYAALGLLTLCGTILWRR